MSQPLPPPERRAEVYSARRLGAPGLPSVSYGYARCRACPWWTATVTVELAEAAAAEHDRCGCRP